MPGQYYNRTKPLPDSPLVPWIEEFIADFDADHEESTVANYRYDLLKLARFNPNFDLADLDGGTGIRNLTAFLKTVSTGQRNRAVSACREFTKWLTYLDQLERDPGQHLRRAKRKPPKPSPMSDDDVAKILTAAAADPWDWLRALIYLQLGLRKMEAAGVRLRDFRGGTLVFTRFKPRRQETLPITKDISFAVEALYAIGAKPSAYVFHVTRVSHITGERTVHHWPEKKSLPNGVHRWWASLLKRADVPHRRLHFTRHTAGSRFYEATLDAALTQRAMGHSDIRTTFSTYIQPDDAKLSSGFEKAAETGLGR